MHCLNYQLNQKSQHYLDPLGPPQKGSPPPKGVSTWAETQSGAGPSRAWRFPRSWQHSLSKCPTSLQHRHLSLFTVPTIKDHITLLFKESLRVLTTLFKIYLCDTVRAHADNTTLCWDSAFNYDLIYRTISTSNVPAGKRATWTSMLRPNILSEKGEKTGKKRKQNP